MKLDTAFKDRCEAIAIDWRYRLGLKPHDPLPANQLLCAIAPDGEVLTPDKVPNLPPHRAEIFMKANDWSAAILRLKPLRILMHPNISAARYESNLMHELGHVLLQHPMVGFSPETGLPMRQPRYEDEATYLGSCLQIPRLGLQWGVKKGFNLSEISNHFGASEEMVRFRANLTGIRVG